MKRGNSKHHLKGSLVCRYCKQRLYYAKAKNGKGGVYPYFFCKGRANGDCRLPYLRVEDVEAKVDRIYRTEVGITREQRQQLLHALNEELELVTEENRFQLEQAEAALEAVENERRMLLKLYYADDISQELFREEQKRLTNEERRARRQVDEARTALPDVIQTVDAALSVLEEWPDQVATAPDHRKRTFNQVFFAALVVGTDTVDATPAPHYAALRKVLDSTGPLKESKVASTDPDNKEPELARAGSGSHKGYLVPRTGFEPVLPP